MEKSQQHRPAQRKAQKLLPALSVAILKPKQSRQQDISILKSARKKTQPAAKMVIQEIHIALIVRKQFHMVRPSQKPVTILGMTEKSQKSLHVQQTA